MTGPYFEDFDVGETWEFDERYEVREAEPVELETTVFETQDVEVLTMSAFVAVRSQPLDRS